MPAASSGAGRLVDPGPGERHEELAHVGRQPRGRLGVVGLGAGEQFEVEASQQHAGVGRRLLGALGRDLGQQRLTVGQLRGVGDLPARGHDVTEATRRVVDAAGLRRRVAVARSGLAAARSGRPAAAVARSGRPAGAVARSGRPAAAVARSGQRRRRRGGAGNGGAGAGGGGAGSGSAPAEPAGRTSVTAVAAVTAATASFLAVLRRCREFASGCGMGKKIPCYRRDASVSCS